MHAMVLHEFGGAQNFRGEDLTEPQTESGWTSVRLRASALNWHDVLVRQGKYNSPLPHVLGADGAGVRLDTGEDVVILPSLWWGDDQSAPGPNWQILGDTQRGTYAEVVRVPTESVVPKPAGFSWAEAAALPLVGVTAFRALFSRGRLKAGESLLVLGAGGGVATMAVALASAVGAKIVVTSSSHEKIIQAQSLGAHDGVLYTEPDWFVAAKALSPGGRGFDVVLDSVGTWSESIQSLRPGGRLVVLGASRQELAAIDVRKFYFGQYELIGTTMGSDRDFADLMAFLANHRVMPPVVDQTYRLDEVAKAHERLEQGEAFGKLVLLQD